MTITTLECSSAGDKRFSAFYALVNGVSIEKQYQACKRNADGTPVAKGRPVHHVVIEGVVYDPSILTAYYRYLWYCYLKAHPELVEYASTFNNFTDKFRGRAINCQADCVKAFVNKDESFYTCILPFLKNK